jgi:gas vesicle structural protein
MHVERTSATSNLVEVLDRVLDKGIVIDAWVRVSLVGIELVTVEARVVVASIATYLGYSDALSDLKQAAAPHPGYPVSTVGKSAPVWSVA